MTNTKSDLAKRMPSEPSSAATLPITLPPPRLSAKPGARRAQERNV
jgi:hypothetical protein